MRFVWYFNTSVTMKSFMLWRCWTDAMECSQLATLFYFDPCPVVRSTGITEADQKRTPFLLSFVFWKYLINRKRKQIWNSTCGGVQGWVGWTKALRFLLGRPVGGFGLWGELLTSFNFCLCSNVLRGAGDSVLNFCFCLNSSHHGWERRRCETGNARLVLVIFWMLTMENERAKQRTSAGPVPLKRIQEKRNQGYLLTLGSVEHHKAVTFATLGWRSELPQLVGLSSLWHLGVAKRAWGAGCFHHHLTYT